MMQIVFTLIFVGFASASVDPCNKGVYCDEGSLVPHPNDCRLYFMCNNGQWSSKNCNVNTLFDKDRLECLNEEDVLCQEPCPMFTGSIFTTTLAPGICDDENNTAPCMEGQKYADRSSCTHYYLCNVGHYFRLQCPTPQVFDVDIADCIFPDSSFNCDNRCRTPAPKNIEITSLSAGTATQMWTTASAITSSTSATSPNLPNIQPDPTIAITSNGTFRTSSAVSDLYCFDEYISEFRKSLKDSLLRAAASDQVCVTNAHSMTFKEGCATLVISDNQGSLRFDYQIIPEETNTIRDTELCAADVQTFIGDFSNWRQPIIADITNCPDVVFTPEKFDVVSMKWQCT